MYRSERHLIYISRVICTLKLVVVNFSLYLRPVALQATMMECPDIFPLGDTGMWMLIGSLYSTNQWWIGTVDGFPPRFKAVNVGIMDYGNGYAAKTGSTFKALPTDRRVVFGFTGWSEPTVVRVK